MKDYGEKIIEAAGLSMNIEMLPISQKLGGNGTILANSLLQMGVRTNYIGALGKAEIHSVFSEFHKYSNVISISDPGYTDAIEFYDGKIISSKLDNLKEVNWDSLKKHISLEQLAFCLDQSNAIGFENWSLLVNVTSIWKGILKEVVPLMYPNKQKTIFFDLADPAKRMDSDIMEALHCISEYQQYFSVTLGVNKKEAIQLANLLGANKQNMTLQELSIYLKEKLKISVVMVHSAQQSCAVGKGGAILIEGPYCEQPKIKTGAGDHFNAGFLYGQMMEFNLLECLILGTANSGCYIRNAESPTIKQLINFLYEWSF
jgi:hypothetical protein